MMEMTKECVLWVGNLSELVTEDILCELFLQAGPVENVKIVKDKAGGKRCFAFVTFKHEESVPYTIALMDGVRLFGKVLRLQTRSGAEIDDNPYMKMLKQYHQTHCIGNVNSFRTHEQNSIRMYNHYSDEKINMTERDNRYSGHQQYYEKESSSKVQELSEFNRRSFDMLRSTRADSPRLDSPIHFSEKFNSNGNYHHKNQGNINNMGSNQMHLQLELNRQQMQQVQMRRQFQPNVCHSLTVPVPFNSHASRFHPYSGTR